MKNFTSEQKKSVRLLDRYKCFICQKWKPNACFSKKQLGTYTYKEGTGQSVDGVSARLRCMACVGGQTGELRCEGPCGLVLALDAFSKQARSNGGSKWCVSCTSWKEAAEPGVTTAPAVSTDIAPDEQDTYNATATASENDNNAAMSDPEAGWSDDEYESYGYPGAGTSELDAASSAGVHTNFTAVPYAGFGALSLSGASENENSYAAPLGQPSRGACGLGSSLSGNVPTYTAYDSHGNAHTKQRVPSETASQASNATVVPERNSNWAKPAGRRVEPKMTTPVVLPSAHGYGSDSEDEM